jgi:hypothetical protein
MDRKSESVSGIIFLYDIPVKEGGALTCHPSQVNRDKWLVYTIDGKDDHRMNQAEIIDNLWKFIRGDFETGEFEQWVYASDELKAWFGNDLYLWCLGVAYHDPHRVWEFRQQLQTVVDGMAPRGCRCITWRNNQKIQLGPGEEWLTIRDQFKTLRRRTPWLSLLQCPTCEEFWYTALDTDGDDYFLHRLDEAGMTAILEEDRWPEDFDRLPIFWPSASWLQHNGFSSLAEWQAKQNL